MWIFDSLCRVVVHTCILYMHFFVRVCSHSMCLRWLPLWMTKLEEITHGCQWVSNRYLNSLLTRSPCALRPSHLPSIKPVLAFKSGNSSNRTLSGEAWLRFLETPDLKHVKRNSTRSNTVPTSNAYAPGYLFQMYVCAWAHGGTVTVVKIPKQFSFVVDHLLYTVMLLRV